ncbi:ferric reductase NAD binding domain-containing protein [Lipomyces doorenjongii]|uniref:ferric reductase NAD binding domain-containing protein n=1 Tax=Lipomyces doorenjongii TaxID=383834 RepID=UPI0034CD7F9B
MPKHYTFIAISACLVPAFAASSLCEATCIAYLQQFKLEGCWTDKITMPCCSSFQYVESYTLCIAHCSVKERLAAWKSFRQVCGISTCGGNNSYDDVYCTALDSNISEQDALTRDGSHTAVNISWENFAAWSAYQDATARNSRNSKIFGAILAGYWALLIAISWFSKLYYHICPAHVSVRGRLSAYIQKHIILPPLYGSRHAEPILIYGVPVTTIPLRWQAYSCVLFLVLNLIFLVAEFNVTGAASLVIDETSQAALYAANRSGIMAVTLMVPLLQFAGRNSLLTRMTGWSNDTFKLFHRWTARTLVLDSLVHSICITAYYLRNGGASRYRAVILRNINIFGILGVVASCMILIQAQYVFQRYWYEIFLTLHLVLTIVFFIALRIHLSNYTFVYYLYVAVTIYAVDRLIRLVRVLSGNVSGYAEIHANADATQIIIKPLVPFKYRPGQYAFLYVLRFNLWQSNPFSVVQTRDNKYIFVAKRRRGVTSKLHGYAVDRDTHRARIWLEGPHGTSYPFGKYESVLLLAGGIGITAAISYAVHLKDKGRKQQVAFLWVVREKASVSWIASQLRHIAENDFIEVHVFVTSGEKEAAEGKIEIFQFEEVMDGDDLSSLSDCRTVFEMDLDDDDRLYKEPVFDDNYDSNGMSEQLFDKFFPSTVHFHYYRPRISRIVRDSMNHESKSLAVFACGPVRMLDEARSAVLENLDDKSGKRIDYFEDAFA